jgi:WD40 repeat protein
MADLVQPSPEPDSAERDFLLRDTPRSARELEDWDTLHEILCDFGFLQAKCGAFGPSAVAEDFTSALSGFPDGEPRNEVACLGRVIEREWLSLTRWKRGQGRLWQPPPAGFFMQQICNGAAALGFGRLRDAAGEYLRERAWPFLEQVWIALSDTHELAATLAGPPSEVHALAVSGDGGLAVSAGSDQYLRVWRVDPAMDMAAIHMNAHQDRVRSLSVTASCDFALTGSWDKSICIWNLGTRGLTARLLGHEDWVTDLAVTPDGRLAVSASYDRTVRLWNLASRQAAGVLRDHRQRVHAVAITPDGTTVLSGDEEGRLLFHAARDGAADGEMVFPDFIVDRIAMSGDGAFAVITCESQSSIQIRDETLDKVERGFEIWEDKFRGVNTNAVFVVDLAARQIAGQFEIELGGARGIAISPGGQSLLVAGADRLVRVFELPGGRPLSLMSGHEKPVNAVAFAQGGKLAVSASDDGTVRVWRLQAPRDAAGASGHAASVSAVAVAETRKGLRGLSVSNEGELRMWNLDDGTIENRVDLNDGVEDEERWGNFAFAPHGRLLAASSDGRKTVRLLRAGDFDVEIPIPLAGGDGILRLMPSFDGKYVGCVTGKCIAYLIDVEASTCRQVWQENGLFLALPVGEERILTAYEERPEAHIREMETGAIVATLQPATGGQVQTMGPTPDGRAVFLSSSDGAVRLWRLASGDTARDWKIGTGSATAISGVAGSSRVAVACSDRLLQLWDLKNVCLMAESMPIGRNFAVAIAPRGDALLAGDANGNVCYLRYADG